MKPYGIKLKDRRIMYDYSSDKYNSRGCFNICNCNMCKANGVRHKIRKNTSRKNTSSLFTKNRMRVAKKKARQLNKLETNKEIEKYIYEYN